MTRDRKVGRGRVGAASAFDVVDTGGWLAAGDSLEAKVSRAGRARRCADADLVLSSWST